MIKIPKRFNPWIKFSKQPPKENDKYLCAVRPSYYPLFYFSILAFTHNLYSVDNVKFKNKKRKSGWYAFDSDLGYYEVDNVEYWMPLPLMPDEYEE